MGSLSYVYSFKESSYMKNILVGLALTLGLLVPSFALTEHPDGSVTLTSQELKALESNVNAVIQQAYTTGVKDGMEAVKSNPKLCPKNI